MGGTLARQYEFDLVHMRREIRAHITKKMTKLKENLSKATGDPLKHNHDDHKSPEPEGKPSAHSSTYLQTTGKKSDTGQTHTKSDIPGHTNQGS